MKRAGKDNSDEAKKQRRAQRTDLSGISDVSSQATTVATGIDSAAPAAALAAAAAAAARADNKTSTKKSSKKKKKGKLTYPNPKSFPERLMLVLESNAEPDTIWWERGGKAVALHVENLKTKPILENHFQGLKYKFFIRYFSRWGFKRISDFSVPFGLYYYQNPLFQQDQPDLVKHMRMDSDVQDVYGQHQSKDRKTGRRGDQATSSSQPHQQVPANNSVGGNESSQQGQPAVDAGLLSQAVGLLGRNTTGVGHYPGQTQTQRQEQLDLAIQLITAMQQQQQQGGNQIQQALAGGNLNQQSHEGRSHQQQNVQGGSQNQQIRVNQPESGNANNLLQMMLLVSGEFLKLPPASNPYSESLRTTLEMFRVFAKEEIDRHQDDGRKSQTAQTSRQNVGVVNQVGTGVNLSAPASNSTTNQAPSVSAQNQGSGGIGDLAALQGFLNIMNQQSDGLSTTSHQQGTLSTLNTFTARSSIQSSFGEQENQQSQVHEQQQQLQQLLLAQQIQQQQFHQPQFHQQQARSQQNTGHQGEMGMELVQQLALMLQQQQQSGPGIGQLGQGPQN